MAKNVPIVAIIGRTNIGKSTLFNAIARRRIAIVEDSPGVTRDRNYALITGYGAPFTLIDTGGLVGEEDESDGLGLHRFVQAQTRLAIKEADLVIAVFDGIAGPHPLDQEVIDELRRAGKNVLWVVNKCERPLTGVMSAEFYASGLDELHCVSAAHRLGIPDLGKAILEKLGLKPRSEDDPRPAQAPVRPIRVAVLGKPNVGKSSIVNRILGEERLVASEMPGTTRDAIDIELTRDGKLFTVVDTAGLRKKARIDPLTVERFSNLRSLRALAGCDVAILVLDASQGMPSDQELKIAELIHERGRGFIIAVNKWDLVEKDHRTVQEFKEGIYNAMPFARYAPIIFVSALSGRRCPNLLRTAAEIYDAARVHIQTSKLNTVLDRIFSFRPPPVVRGGPVRLFFATQSSVAPPTILLFVNYPQELQASYFRYIKQQLRKEYPFTGVDIKLITKKRTEKGQQRVDQAGTESAEVLEAEEPLAEIDGMEESFADNE